MSNVVPTWPLEEIQTFYTMGHCHAMALAIAHRTGLPVAIMWNGLDWHVEPDEKGRGGVREVVHVYVDCGDGHVLDVMGRRTLLEMKRAFAPYEHDVCPCEPLDERTLSSLMHDSRNLVAVDQSYVDEALEVIDALSYLRTAVEEYSPVTASP